MTVKTDTTGICGSSIEEHIEIARNSRSNTEEEGMFQTLDTLQEQEPRYIDERNDTLLEVAELSATSVVEALKR